MADWLSTLLVLCAGLPLAAAAVTALLGPRWLRQYAHVPVVIAIGASLAVSVMLAIEVVRMQNAGASPGAPMTAAASGEESTASFERVYTLWTWANVPADPQSAGSADTNADSASGVSPNSASPAGFHVSISLRADALTAVMLVIVTAVSLLVAIYSIGYMHGDRGYSRFFATIGLFVFSMILLVTASNFVILFVAWEGVGLCSYLLIGFWYQKPEAAAAGKKAFLVNRVGDFGLLLAVFLIWTNYGTTQFHSSDRALAAFPHVTASGQTPSSATPNGVSQPDLKSIDGTSRDADAPVVLGLFDSRRVAAGDYRTGGVGLAICLLLMLSACGKSAQFPLHVWLPDAMEGPTPVSALIHAATMVTAGVYLVARCTPLFLVSPDAQLVVAAIGGFTALLAALIAMTQYDLKRVLAYSTISQLGYMFLALGSGTLAGITAGMFHLVTHAFFKALLFLGAGSVMHATGGIIDMRRLGGLRRALPVAHWTFLIGCLALAGVPPLAGFWSKDAILGAVEERAHAVGGEETHVALAMTTNADGARAEGVIAVAPPSALAASGMATEWFHLTPEQVARAYWWLFGGALFTALLTGFYTFRAYFMTFCGPMRTPMVGHSPHDDDGGHAAHPAADEHSAHDAASHSHEPAVMYAPLILLAVGAVVAGLLLDQSAFGGPHLLAEFLGRAPSLAVGAAGGHVGLEFDPLLAGLSALVALAAIGAAAYLYLGDPRDIQRLTSLLRFDWLDRVADRQWVAELRRRPWVVRLEAGANRVGLGWLAAILGTVFLLVVLLVTTPLMLLPLVSPYRLSFHKFYFDEIHSALIVWPLRGIAAVCGWLDRWLVDGTVNTVGRVPPAVGSVLRRLQTGLAPLYALSMLIGTLLLVIVWLLVPRA